MKAISHTSFHVLSHSSMGSFVFNFATIIWIVVGFAASFFVSTVQCPVDTIFWPGLAHAGNWTSPVGWFLSFLLLAHLSGGSLGDTVLLSVFSVLVSGVFCSSVSVKMWEGLGCVS